MQPCAPWRLSTVPSASRVSLTLNGACLPRLKPDRSKCAPKRFGASGMSTACSSLQRGASSTAKVHPNCRTPQPPLSLPCRTGADNIRAAGRTTLSWLRHRAFREKPHSLYHHIQACPVQHRKPPFATRLCPGSPYHLRLHTSNPISPQDKQLPATMLSVRILFRHRPDRAGATAYGQNRINAPAYRPVVTTRRPTTPPASGTEKSAPAPARHSRQNMA